MPTTVPRGQPWELSHGWTALVHDGVLELSLQDSIALALENNLDLAIARYNIPIRSGRHPSHQGRRQHARRQHGRGAEHAGRQWRGRLRLRLGAGAGAGGTSGGAGGAGTGASGLVQSTLGSGTTVNSYDPIITGEHRVCSIPQSRIVEPRPSTVCPRCATNSISRQTSGMQQSFSHRHQHRSSPTQRQPADDEQPLQLPESAR